MKHLSCMLGLLVAAMLLACSEDSSSNANSESSSNATSFKDPRDGISYRIVTIGDQTWMAENLMFVESDGKGSGLAWRGYYGPSKITSVCPSGWHLPSLSEWEILIETVGGWSVAGKMLKSNSGWYANGNGTDSYGFNASPSGYWGHGDSPSDRGRNTYYRASGGYLYLTYERDDARVINDASSSKMMSVRCLKD